MDAIELEHKRSSACDRMRWAGELESALGAIRGEIVHTNQDPSISPRDKSMNELQLRYAIKVLERARNRYAEEAVKLWTSANGSPSP